MPLLVLLHGLVERISGARPVLHLLHAELSAASLERVGRLVEMRAWRFDPGEIPPHPRFPPEAAAPLLLPQLLPESLDRVLFLDADLLVMDDVRRLWEWDLQGNVIAAGRDSAIPTCGSARGVKDLAAWGVRPEAEYFNGGVLVIDLQAWRRADVTARAFGYLRRTGSKVDFLHQEALNAVLGDRCRSLPARWNLLGGVAGRRFERPESEAWRDPAIVHFAGRLKPWRTRVGGRFEDAYRAALERAGLEASRSRPGWRGALYSRYDRTMRDFLYPAERLLWRMRLL